MVRVRGCVGERKALMNSLLLIKITLELTLCFLSPIFLMEVIIGIIWHFILSLLSPNENKLQGSFAYM